jgi:type I restriction enzyme R subunit
MEQNEDIFARFMGDNGFQRLVSDWLISDVYRKMQQPE